MLKCVIIEDEFPAREELKFFIEKHNGIEVEKGRGKKRKENN